MSKLLKSLGQKDELTLATDKSLNPNTKFSP